MDTSPPHQASSGPMTRARARAIENEVNSLLYDFHMDMDGTWMLPHKGTLCIIRYDGVDRQEAKDHRQGQEESRQGQENNGGRKHEEDSTSQETPCARPPKTPCTRDVAKLLETPCARPPETPCARDVAKLLDTPCPRAPGPRAHGPRTL
jgi:hypothetical protein